MKKQHSIGKDKAIKMYESSWWKGKSYREIAGTQLFIAELCCPFDVFHEAVEKSLDRSVFTHEFGLNYSGICDEFLGNKEPPTIEEILGLIPQEKIIIVNT
jgi:hypothetical protein